MGAGGGKRDAVPPLRPVTPLTFWSVAGGGAVAEGLCAAAEGYSGRLGSAGCVPAAALACCTRRPLPASASSAFISGADMSARGRAIDCGSAHPGDVPAAALPCKSRAAPADASWWFAQGPPCDGVGHQPHEPRTPFDSGASLSAVGKRGPDDLSGVAEDGVAPPVTERADDVEPAAGLGQGIGR
jgi:hypothetical protein